MPQYSSYPVVSAMADADVVLFHQDATNLEKLITFADLVTAIAVPPPLASFVASQYTSVTNTCNGGGTQVANALSGSIRGSLTIDADRFVVGSMLRFRFSGFISTSGAGMSFQLRPYVQSTAITAQIPTTITAGPITDELFIYEGSMIIVTAGAGGTFIGQGRTIIGSTIYPQVSTVTSNIDTTAIETISAETIWTGGNASDEITITEAVFEII